MALIKTKMIITNGAFLIRGRILINWQVQDESLRRNGNSWAQEVSDTFVKVLTDPVSGKSGRAKFYATPNRPPRGTKVPKISLSREGEINILEFIILVKNRPLE
jgi:hypothetical protein